MVDPGHHLDDPHQEQLDDLDLPSNHHEAADGGYHDDVEVAIPPDLAELYEDVRACFCPALAVPLTVLQSPLGHGPTRPLKVADHATLGFWQKRKQI